MDSSNNLGDGSAGCVFINFVCGFIIAHMWARPRCGSSGDAKADYVVRRCELSRQRGVDKRSLFLSLLLNCRPEGPGYVDPLFNMTKLEVSKSLQTLKFASLMVHVSIPGSPRIRLAETPLWGQATRSTLHSPQGASTTQANSNMNESRSTGSRIASSGASRTSLAAPTAVLQAAGPVE